MRMVVAESRWGLRLVRFEGVLDYSTAPGIRRKMLKILRDKDVERLEIDFSAVDSIDTAGLALLIELVGYLKRRGGGLRLKGANEQVLRIIHLVRVDSLFEILNHKSNEN